MEKNEEKALEITNYYKTIESLEDRICVFLHHEEYSNQIPNWDLQSLDSHDSVRTTLFWESQQALLQEVLERYNMTGSRLREEIKRIIEKAKESKFCSCLEPYNCISCLRRKVVDFLSQRGLNASLSTSLWKPTNKFPGGKHEYIQVRVNTSGKKKEVTYIVELEFKGQFEIAKASDEYKRLIGQLPNYYIGKSDYLNAIIGIICDSAKRSMKEKKLHMGPWRTRSFMQMKWSTSSLIQSPLDRQPSSITNNIATSNSNFSLLPNTHFSVAPTIIVS